jgi:hypothetical protein
MRLLAPLSFAAIGGACWNQPPTASGTRSRNTAAPITPTLSGRPVRAAYESGSAVK